MKPAHLSNVFQQDAFHQLNPQLHQWQSNGRENVTQRESSAAGGEEDSS